MDDAAPNTAEFTARAEDVVSAILPAESVDGCRGALAGAGVGTFGVDVLVGAEGRAILDGSNEGWKGQTLRFLQKIGTAGTYLEMYEAALDRGSAVMTVPVADRAEAEATASTLKRFGGSYVQFFNGPSSVESM